SKLAASVMAATAATRITVTRRRAVEGGASSAKSPTARLRRLTSAAIGRAAPSSGAGALAQGLLDGGESRGALVGSGAAALRHVRTAAPALPAECGDAGLHQFTGIEA